MSARSAFERMASEYGGMARLLLRMKALNVVLPVADAVEGGDPVIPARDGLVVVAVQSPRIAPVPAATTQGSSQPSLL